jgi:hypothetical protein
MGALLLFRTCLFAPGAVVAADITIVIRAANVAVCIAGSSLSVEPRNGLPDGALVRDPAKRDALADQFHSAHDAMPAYCPITECRTAGPTGQGAVGAAKSLVRRNAALVETDCGQQEEAHWRDRFAWGGKFRAIVTCLSLHQERQRVNFCTALIQTCSNLSVMSKNSIYSCYDPGGVFTGAGQCGGRHVRLSNDIAAQHKRFSRHAGCT